MPLSRLVVCILSGAICSDGRTTTATLDGVVIAGTLIKNGIATAGGAATEDGDILYLFVFEYRYMRSCYKCYYYAPGNKVVTVIEKCPYCRDEGWWKVVWAYPR